MDVCHLWLRSYANALYSKPSLHLGPNSFQFLRFLTFTSSRIWPRQKRRHHNNVIGWELGILGTTHAVVLGFMLYTVWTEMNAADIDISDEANAITNIHLLAEDLPSPQREQIAFCRLFGAEAAWLHAIHVFCFSLLVVIIVVAIADIDRLFQGSVQVSDSRRCSGRHASD